MRPCTPGAGHAAAWRCWHAYLRWLGCALALTQPACCQLPVCRLPLPTCRWLNRDEQATARVRAGASATHSAFLLLSAQKHIKQLRRGRLTDSTIMLWNDRWADARLQLRLPACGPAHRCGCVLNSFQHHAGHRLLLLHMSSLCRVLSFPARSISWKHMF